MIKWSLKEPEVTPCLILIQETDKQQRHPFFFDVYLLDTAVRKYYIGLGQRQCIKVSKKISYLNQ